MTSSFGSGRSKTWRRSTRSGACLARDRPQSAQRSTAMAHRIGRASPPCAGCGPDGPAGRRWAARWAGAGSWAWAWRDRRKTAACCCCASPWRPALPTSDPPFAGVEACGQVLHLALQGVDASVHVQQHSHDGFLAGVVDGFRLLACHHAHNSFRKFVDERIQIHVLDRGADAVLRGRCGCAPGSRPAAASWPPGSRFP